MITDIDPRGPFFISYRQSDGTTIAVELSWLLRAAGVPVWHDATDLPPGDTESRLREALAAGIAGAALVVTEDIADSIVVRTLELRALLDREPNPQFLFTVANTLRTEQGGLDYHAPDTLLQQPRGTLASKRQDEGDHRAGLLKTVRDAVRHRLLNTSRSEPGVLLLDVQTRSVPVARPLTGADLDIRTRPPVNSRLPHGEGLRDLADALAFLPEAVGLTGARTVRVSGAAHLCAAFALGATLPATLVGDLQAIDSTGQVWTAPAIASPAPGPATVEVIGHGNGAHPAPGRARVLLYIDLLPARSDAAYTRFLEEDGDDFTAWVHLRPAVPGPLQTSTAGELVAELAHRLRELTAQHSNAEAHLLLRCPFPIAVLLGRLTNTLRVVIYEWDDDDPAQDDTKEAADPRPRYVPALRVRATASASPIQQVMLP